MSKIDLYDPQWVNMIFQGRNKAYGAYKLRTSISKRNVMAIVIMLIAAAIIASILGIQAIVKANQQQVAVTTSVELSQLAKQKKKPVVEKRTVVKEEKKEVVKQVKSSIKFTAPVIKKDNEVKKEIVSQADLNNTKTAIGAFDVKGNSDQGTVLKAEQEIAQPAPPAPKPSAAVENKVFDVVEQMPSFPGGPSALMAYLNNNVKYPVVAQENGVQGRVVISFVVERDGSITDVQVVKSVDPSLDREASRVVRSMPRWNPGKQNGQAVRVKYNVPVSFRLQ
ncbi:MAG: energy transducer TonB [Prevotella sp.]|jgi:protein TonB|uniref:Energy transducer TonB n=1 Tax=Segatella cerevisiae TaxID=2053716 RepID=A0ABT1BYG3_9BACT|nr:energy transducer TonB [Segatella cerevisiae]MCH3994517.1 energy transducer TonB [Prevotella sp.]MCI1245862.1 energy transducer TonB [Prevotella sp.]MCO6026123.1 energy transducer TonB [Segatella cerevisiae]